MRRILNTLLVVAALGALALSGCKKAEAPTSPKVEGVTVDVPKLQQAFATAPPDVLSDVTQVSFGVRYGDYMKSLAALDKLSSNPTLTEPQKKVVNEVLEQVKQVMAQQQAKPAAQ